MPPNLIAVGYVAHVYVRPLLCMYTAKAYGGDSYMGKVEQQPSELNFHPASSHLCTYGHYFQFWNCR